MKSFLTKRNIFLCVGALLAIAAFFLAFGASLVQTSTTMVGEVKSTLTNIIIGKQTVVTEVAGQSKTMDVPADEVVRATLSLVGTIMMLVAGLAAAVIGLFCKDKNWNKAALIAAAVLILVGAIFVFLVKSSYIASTAAKNGLDIEVVKEAFADAKVGVLAIVSGVVGVLSAISVAASALVKD